MNCLTEEQLVQLALARPGPDGGGAEAEHARACSACAAALARAEAGLRRVAAAHARFDEGHAEARQRLLAALPALNPARRGRLIKMKEVLTMRRVLIGAAAAVLAVGLFLGWASRNAPALAQTVEALKEVKTYRCRYVEEPGEKAKDKKADRETGVYCWAAPGSSRFETYKGGKLAEVRILVKGKPGIEINHRDETYCRLEPLHAPGSPLFLLGSLARYSGQADAELPERKIDGQAARGFEIAFAKIDPDAGEGTLRVWVSPKSKLPLRVEMVFGDAGRMVLEKFEWNVPTDKWFNEEPPAKYRDKTPNVTPVEEITKDIVTGLKTYAKYCGGKYPQARMVYGDVTGDELCKAAGLSSFRKPAPKEERDRPEYAECQRAVPGFGWINTIQRHNPDAVWNGKTVGPDDKDKVLFRWKLEDGRYRVIYGDLRAETVTAERLKKLEKR
jgi:outer membrane lipoprotein-sorting protein